MAVVDVRSDTDIEEFENTLHTGPITIILVYADWCGHCKTYMRDIWLFIMNWRNQQEKKGVPMNQLASVHYDQLPKTSQRSVNLDGYPSILVVGKDGKAASFAKGKNALPSQTARNLEALKEMLKQPVSAAFSAEASGLREKMNTALRSHTIEEMKEFSPPDSWKDLTKTQRKTRRARTAKGKTLLQSLMRTAKLTGGTRRRHRKVKRTRQ